VTSPGGRSSALPVALRAAGVAVCAAGQALQVVFGALADLLDERGDLLLGGADPEEFLSVDQAAKISSTGERRIRDAANSRELRGFRPGKELLIKRADLRAWIESCPIRPTAEKPPLAVTEEAPFDAEAAVLSKHKPRV